MGNLAFGFYPVRLEASLADFRIETASDFDSSIAIVSTDPLVYQGWIYPPLRELRSFGTGGIRTLPYPSRVFGLPKTHSLIHKENDPVRLRFLVWCFGFFVGMRMSDQEAGFLDAAAVEPGTSNDIVWFRDSLLIALGFADQFYSQHLAQSKVALTVRAAIHSYLTSDTPTLLDYEKFIHLYTAIDACFAIHKLIAGKPKKRVTHAQRIAYLCEQLDLPIPWWADHNSAFVADQRNEVIHEGLFFGEPWGFAIWGGEHRDDPKQAMMMLEMQKLTCRIILALLGVRASTYLRSSVSDRQRHGIRL